jgi:site-specific recombinase
MIRAATPKGILDIVGKLLLCLLIGSLAGRIAKYFGAPMEIRLLAFAALTGIALAIWHLGGTTEDKANAA